MTRTPGLPDDYKKGLVYGEIGIIPPVRVACMEKEEALPYIKRR
jgi:hypothetical protein